MPESNHEALREALLNIQRVREKEQIAMEQMETLIEGLQILNESDSLANMFREILGSLKRVNLVREFVDENYDYKCCSICNQLSSGDTDYTQWDEFQTLVETGKHAANAAPMRCTYDVCEDCERAVTQRMNETLRKFDRRAG